jgi:hypothetical protein
MSNTYHYEMAKANAKKQPNKIEAVMAVYQKVFPDRKLEKRGSWIKVDEPNNFTFTCYSNDLLEEIFDKTGNWYEWDSEWKILKNVARETDSDSLWSTNDTWDTNPGPIHVTEPASARQILEAYEEENLFDDIGEV